MMKSIGVAVIGCGFAGNFHSNAWVKVNYLDIKLKAAVDSQIERAESLKEKWNYEYATADYEKVLSDPEVDIIDITLPRFSICLLPIRQWRQASMLSATSL